RWRSASAQTARCSPPSIPCCSGRCPPRTPTSSSALSRHRTAHGSARHPLLWCLVGVQVALSVTLLASAGLLLPRLDNLSRVDPAFDSRHVLTFHVSGSYEEVRDYDRYSVSGPF